MFNVRYIVWRILKRIVTSSQRLIQLQKVHLIDCIHTSEFGLCQPLNIYKVGIQWSLYQLKLLNSPQIWMDYLQWHCLQFNHIKRKSRRIKMTRNMHKFENTSIKFQILITTMQSVICTLLTYLWIQFSYEFSRKVYFH